MRGPFEAAGASCGVLTPPAIRKLPMADYVAALADCRWGVILGGKRGTDRKNRRESEYASCGVPLALNYQPSYSWPFRPGHEYVYLAAPDDLRRLADTDPRPYAEASRRLWRERYSPAGAARTLLDVLGLKSIPASRS